VRRWEGGIYLALRTHVSWIFNIATCTATQCSSNSRRWRANARTGEKKGDERGCKGSHEKTL